MRVNATLLAILLAASLRAQSIGISAEGVPDLGDPCCIAEGIPRTIEQMLERRGVQHTPQALIYALLDSRAVVRSLAAGQLAQDKQTGALIYLAEALSRENAAGTRESMGAALAAMGDARGFDTLRSICQGGDGLITLRMTAAQDLFRLRDETCLDGFLVTLRSVEAASPLDPGRNNLLTVGVSAFKVFEFQRLSPSQLEGIRAFSARCLANNAAEVRLEAFRALAKFADADSIRLLRKALDAEQSGFNRPRMREAFEPLSGSHDN